MKTVKLATLTLLAATLLSCGPMPQQGTPGAPKPTAVPSKRYIQRVLTSPLPAEEPYQDNVVAKTLAAMPASCYLIDSSGSMDDLVPGGSVKKIDVVRKFKFPENAIVYAFNSSLRGGDAVPFAQLVPDNNTPLYSSIINMLSNENCTDLSVFTDGRDNVRGTLNDAIAAALNAKVPINAGAIGTFGIEGILPVNGAYSSEVVRSQTFSASLNRYGKNLLRLGCETGGKVTFNGVDVACPSNDVNQ